MKPSETIDLTVQMPVADVMSTLAPRIDDLVNQRVAETLDRQDLGARRTRRLIIALTSAIRNVNQAIVRFENSQHTKDEQAAIGALIAASKGLRKAYTDHKKDI